MRGDLDGISTRLLDQGERLEVLGTVVDLKASQADLEGVRSASAGFAKRAEVESLGGMVASTLDELRVSSKEARQKADAHSSELRRHDCELRALASSADLANLERRIEELCATKKELCEAVAPFQSKLDQCVSGRARPARKAPEDVSLAAAKSLPTCAPPHASLRYLSKLITLNKQLSTKADISLAMSNRHDLDEFLKSRLETAPQQASRVTSEAAERNSPMPTPEDAGPSQIPAGAPESPPGWRSPDRMGLSTVFRLEEEMAELRVRSEARAVRSPPSLEESFPARPASADASRDSCGDDGCRRHWSRSSADVSTLEADDCVPQAACHCRYGQHQPVTARPASRLGA